VLDTSTGEIVDTAKRTGAQVAGLFRCHDEEQVLRTAFAACGQEVARGVRDSHHKRLIDILEPTQQTVDALMKLDLPAGVDVEIKTVQK